MLMNMACQNARYVPRENTVLVVQSFLKLVLLDLIVLLEMISEKQVTLYLVQRQHLVLVKA